MKDDQRTLIDILLIIISILLFIGLILACGLDMQFQNMLPENDIYNWLVLLKEKMNPFGIKYQKIQDDILTSGIGFLMTIVSMFISMNKGIIDNSEKMIYGIPRSELPVAEKNAIFVWVCRINYIMPIILVFFVLIDFWLCGLWTLIYSYSCMLLSHFVYRNNYNKKMNQKVLLAKLVDIFQENRSEFQKAMSTSAFVIEDVGNYIIKNEEWNNGEQIFNGILESKKLESKEKYYLLYAFYKKVFRDSEQRNKEILNKYIKKYLNAALTEENGMLTWILAEIIFLYISEKELVSFLDWLLDYERRSEEIWYMQLKRVSINDMDRQISIFAVFMEYYLQCNKRVTENVLPLLKKLLTNGKELFNREEMDEYFRFSMEVGETKDSNKLNKAISELADDYKNGSNISLMYKMAEL